MRFLAIFLLLTMVVTSCRTTEENYRAAYDKAIVGRDSAIAFDNTIYGRHRRNIGVQTLAGADGDTVEMRTLYVKLTEGGGGVKEWLRPYSVVVGQFKTSTNAISMRERLVDAGYSGAFVVENGEPYYFVLLSSFPTREEALAEIAAIKKSKFPFPMKDPLPYVLHIGRGR